MGHEIVVGVDSSDASARAVDLACQVAETGSGWSLLLIHVIKWSPFSFTTPEENERRHERRQEEIAAAEANVIAPLRQRVADAGRTCVTMIRHGDPVDVIGDVAEEEGARVIVVGRTGDSGLRERLFGGVTSHLVHTSPVPVVVVP